MRPSLIRTIVAAGTFSALVAGHLTFAPRSAMAGDLHVWGFSNLGDTCSGTCGANNICCRITIVTSD
jgi:hypothetical protein